VEEDSFLKAGIQGYIGPQFIESEAARLKGEYAPLGSYAPGQRKRVSPDIGANVEDGASTVNHLVKDISGGPLKPAQQVDREIDPFG
jgi:hypothetical protein